MARSPASVENRISRLWATSVDPETMSTSLPPAPKVGGKAQPRPRNGASVGIDACSLERDLALRLELEILARFDLDSVLAHEDAVGIAVAEADFALVVVDPQHGLGSLQPDDGLAVLVGQFERNAVLRAEALGDIVRRQVREFVGRLVLRTEQSAEDHRLSWIVGEKAQD